MSRDGLVSRVLLRMKSFWQRFSSGSDFLCDTCKYNYGSACRRPERPNARVCPDYKRR